MRQIFLTNQILVDSNFKQLIRKNGVVEEHEHHSEHRRNDGSHCSHVSEEDFVGDLSLEHMASSAISLRLLGKGHSVEAVSLCDFVNGHSLH